MSGRTNSCPWAVRMTCTSRSPLLQLSHQFSRLISGNPARDANGYFHGFTFRVLPVCVTPGPVAGPALLACHFLLFLAEPSFSVLVGIR